MRIPMTTLPATYADALREEMVARVAEAIRLLEAWVPVSEEEAISFVLNYLRRGPRHQQNITLNAERGDYLAHLAIERFYKDLMLTHMMPPVPIVAYMLDPRRHPRPPPGRGSWENIRRDLSIAMIIDWLVKCYDVEPMRNPASSRKTPCGASIMAEAFTRCGHAIKEKTVANVLARRTEWGGTYLSMLEYARVQGGMSRLKRQLSL